VRVIAFIVTEINRARFIKDAKSSLILRENILKLFIALLKSYEKISKNKRSDNMTDDQPNYLCNDDDLNSLTDYFNAALAGEESKSRLRQMWEQEIGIIKVTHPALKWPWQNESFFKGRGSLSTYGDRDLGEGISYPQCRFAGKYHKDENDCNCCHPNTGDVFFCATHHIAGQPRCPGELANNNNPVPNSKELILLAETDWHNREERKHRYEMIPWTMGWMAGFLSERKSYWPKVHEAAVRKDEREKVLSIINEENNARLKGLEILFATPADKRAELAQDVYLKEAYFELTLVKHLVESLHTTTPTQEPPHGP